MTHCAPPDGLRCLIECGDYEFGNLGDVAMLQVTVQRLRDLLPSAGLYVVTRNPAGLELHCPGTRPASYEGRQLWTGRGVLLGRADGLLRRTRFYGGDGVEGVLRRHCAPLLERLVGARIRETSERDAFASFVTTLAAADAVVVCGAGGITDHARSWATAVLALLEYATARDLPSAMFGHGLGPIADPELRRSARRVLPKLDLLALRESRAGEPLARALGVAPGRLCVTGDDAIELAHAARPPALGHAIGVNLRVSRSAGVDETYIEPVRSVLQRCAMMWDTGLIPLPIGRGKASNDPVMLERLLEGAGRLPSCDIQLSTPEMVIAQAGRCRIVVTGAYHAAVFALAQGIPAVCLARSAYFCDKFLGLADQFGEGCTVIDLGAPELPSRLASAMQHAWETADQSRPALLEAAIRQIAASRSAYDRFARLVVDRAALRRSRPSRRPATTGSPIGSALQAASSGGEPR